MKAQIKLAYDGLFAILLNLAPRLTSVLLFILIGRLAGPSEAGTFSLAVTYLLLATMAARGLDDLVVRQVSRNPDQAPDYFSSFLLLRLILSFVSYSIVLVLTSVIFEYDASTTSTILILSLGLIPDNVGFVAQSILMGKRHFALPAITVVSVGVLRLLGGGMVLLLKGQLQHIALVWFLTSVVGMFVLLVAAFGRVGKPKSMRTSWYPVVQDWRATLTFFAITALMTLEAQADIVFLGALHGEETVGWYAAATTVAFGLSMISQAYHLSVYPVMTRYALSDPDKLIAFYERSVLYLGAIALPVVAGITLLSPSIVTLVFGPEFSPAARILRVLVFSLLFVFLSAPDSRMMLVHNRQNTSWLFVVCSVTVNLLLNLVLARPWGALGAATARLCSTAFFFILGNLYVSRSLTHRSAIPRLLTPALATAVMAIAVWVLRGWPLAIIVAIGIAVYVGGLCCLGWILQDDIGRICRTIVKRYVSRHLRRAE